MSKASPVSFFSALQVIQSVAQSRKVTIQSEILPVEKALGRIAAENIHAPLSIPSFATSSMDGFAVVSSQTQNASEKDPITLRVLGSSSAGDYPQNPKNLEGAWEIMTGAPIPHGFDSVVKIEDVQVQKAQNGQGEEILLCSPAETGQNFRKIGEDFLQGTPVISKGSWILPEHFLSLLTLGVSTLPVFRKPKISILSTGKELVDASLLSSPQSLLPGQITNSTGPFLKAILEQWGTDVSFVGNIPDEASIFYEKLKQVLAENPDIIITTGGVSMGKHDFVPGSLMELGAEILFHKIQMRPGKPNLFAQFKKGPVVFGLPGNPVSTAVGLRFLVEPFLRELQSRPAEKPLKARLTSLVSKPKNLRCFYKAKWTLEESQSMVEILPGQASFMVSPLLASNAWAVLKEEQEDFSQNSWIEIYPLNPHLPSSAMDNSSGERKAIGMKGCC